MSSPGQWVATCSTHVVLDGVPFKISDNFRTAPVVASSEGRLCLRSQSLCLQTQYLFEKEIECLRRYEDFIFARESAEESKKKEAEAAAAAAAASAAAVAKAVVSSAERGLGDADQGWAAAAAVAGVADSGSGGAAAATGTGRWRSSPAPAVAQRPAARPTRPNMGHDLLVPKPVVPLKPKLSNGAGSASAAASLGGLPAGKAAPLDLALFEQEEDVFDKMQLRTLNDFEELRSVLQPREATPVQAIDRLEAESGSDSGGCDNSPLHRGAVDVARGCKESSGWVADRAPDSAAGIAAASAASANSPEVALSLVTTDSSRVGAGGARSSAATAPSAVMAATEAGAGSSTSLLSAVGADGMTATTTGVRGTVTASAPATSCASPVAASRAALPLDSAAKPRPLTHRKVLPSLPPPKRLVSTDDGSEPGAVATASDVPTAVATSGSLTRAAVRLPPRPPPPKPIVQQAERPANASLRKPPTLPPAPALLPGKPFSYVAGAGSPLQSLTSPRSGLGSNAWAVKNIVWPELLSSPEAATASVAAAARLSSAATPDSSFDSGPVRSIDGQPGNQLAVSRPTVASPGAGTRRDPAANGGANDDDDGLASKLLAMGFPWRHVEAAVKEFGKDDKKVVEHLCILSDLVDKGYDWTIAQKAILSYPGQLAKVQEYLLSYRRLLEYGFEGQKIQQALMAHDANAEKALDVLAGTASS